MSSLSFEGVRKTFGSTIALHGLELALKPGELVSLVGPSGCGKTTALRIAAGFEQADSGRVVVGGEDISATPPHRRNMGMVFQSYSLFPNLTVAANVEYGLRTRKVERQARRKRVGEMIELVQLQAHLDKYPHQLSGGQQQRVALARALAIEPSVLLLDEPLSALDAKVRASVREEIRGIQTELGITTLFVTHDQEEALAMSDRVAVMSEGRMEQLGSPAEVYRHPATAFVARFIGTMNQLAARVIDKHAVALLDTVVRVPLPNGCAPGAAVTLLVRPEDTSFVGDGTGLRGSVTSLKFEGASTTVGVRLDRLDQVVGVHLVGSAEGRYSIGDPVAVAIDGERAVIEPTLPPGTS